MNKNGFILLEVPYSESVLMEYAVINKKKLDRFLEPGRHLYFFSNKFFKIIAKKLKMKLIDFETNGLAALNPGVTNFAALPNNFKANPPIFCAPFIAPFFNPPVIVFFNPFFPTLLRNFLPPRPINLPTLAFPLLTEF